MNDKQTLRLKTKKSFINVLMFAGAALMSQASFATQAPTAKPNIVIIYTDDLGIGDVSAYGVGKLSTPNIDTIADQGIKFTNGYATAATCTPSRFSILTGQYPWRKGVQILPGDAPLLISPEQQTLPKMLKQAGYTTAVIGKWHLGLGNGQMDWNEHIPLGPNEVGFDYSYIMAATNDRVPNVFVKNGDVVGLEQDDPLYVSYKSNFPGEVTGQENPELLTKMTYHHGHDQSINNGVSRIGYQKGGKAAQWIDEDMSDLFLSEAQRFVKRNQAKPFFLFYTLHQPHVPRVPNRHFVGKSGLGPRGDAILEADWAIGQFLETLDQLGLSDNTLIVFSSDNGPVLNDGYNDQADTKNGQHTPWGQFRGGKYSLFEAGTHIPLMVRWQGKIKPGVSDALISQHDLLASFASMTGQKIKASDSQNMLSALTGQSKTGRKSLLLEGMHGRTAYREGDWIVIPAYKGNSLMKKQNIETGIYPFDQLYNISTDPGQQHNLASQYPEKISTMLKHYQAVMQPN
ncbi:sulfatase family protein [Thalassotalea sp. ND16A]|uniref:sulfatase family protein n=1 Tax=Thalassotalea sp. ND16A TaxID=1535422 RepID=UPI00051CE5ED|nr:arylsulfatase [Thalassotalea sp. ND16A]KGK00120.1 hypothetical protein ND16A_0311 [Thalassotalea sp. ND16A]